LKSNGVGRHSLVRQDILSHCYRPLNVPRLTPVAALVFLTSALLTIKKLRRCAFPVANPMLCIRKSDDSSISQYRGVTFMEPFKNLPSIGQFISGPRKATLRDLSGMLCERSPGSEICGVCPVSGNSSSLALGVLATASLDCCVRMEESCPTKSTLTN
jgi:hypothetical protein